MPCPGTPRPPWPVIGRESEVPGLGSAAVAFSSRSTSATPSSSKSVSSTQASSVSARHLRYQTAWSYGLAASNSVQSAMQSSYLCCLSLCIALKTGSSDEEAIGAGVLYRASSLLAAVVALLSAAALVLYNSAVHAGRREGEVHVGCGEGGCGAAVGRVRFEPPPGFVARRCPRPCLGTGDAHAHVHYWIRVDSGFVVGGVARARRPSGWGVHVRCVEEVAEF